MQNIEEIHWYCSDDECFRRNVDYMNPQRETLAFCEDCGKPEDLSQWHPFWAGDDGR